VIVGALMLGLAAMATGNNLLFLILGAMLGLIALSGWLSEVVLRGVSVERRVPRAITAGEPAQLTYRVANRKRVLASFSLEVGERRHAEGSGFIASVPAGGDGQTRVERRWECRGVYPLDTVTLATSFPFGLFRKERDLEVAGEVVVRPRTERPVREPRPSGDRRARTGEVAAGASAARGEFRSLRGYVAGDDPRDVHWRSTARVGTPVIREYAREQAQTLWICVDLAAPAASSRSAVGDRVELSPGEVVIEIAAALAARAAEAGRPFALATLDNRLDPGTGEAQLERVLDALARARLRPDAPPLAPPAAAEACVLVTARAGATAAAWGDTFTPADP
jgi:uncharacterized protein (DUF58 family)